MKAFAILILASTAMSSAQSLTVHTLDEKTGRPMKGVPVTIRMNFMEPRKAKKGEVITIKSDEGGKTEFSNLTLNNGGFDVSVFSMSLQGVGLPPVFFPPDVVDKKLMNPTYTSLPADITVRVHRRSFRERLELIYPGP
jgi:hypothetical protein